jgi:redox-sensitive bicupin YhaK (pirin superfamily)
VASQDASQGSLKIHQDARIYLAKLDAGKEVSHELSEARHAWVQVLSGHVILNGQLLSTSDGAAVSDERLLKIKAEEEAEIMLFDLA